MSYLTEIDISQQFAPAQKFNTISSFVNLIIANLFIGAALILFIGIVIGGFTIMNSGGNAESMTKGQKTLTYSAVGFIIILLSYFVTKVILQITGVQSAL